MTWFKVDDGLHSHRKAVRAGVAAMGLWVLAGSWASDQLTDGWVPDYIAARIDPGQAEKHAAALVKAGLWIVDEHDGERGWWFHQWDDHQPTAKSVHDQRAAAKERMSRLREQRRLDRKGASERKAQVSNDEFGERSREHPANVQANFARSSLTPTRPDPTRPVVPTELHKDTSLTGSVSLTLVPNVDSDPEPEAKPGAATKTRKTRSKHTYDDPAFDRFWDSYPRKTGKPSAYAAWAAAVARGADPELVIAAAEAYRNDRNREDRFTKHPGPWLNDERYNDQPALPNASGGGWWDN